MWRCRYPSTHSAYLHGGSLSCTCVGDLLMRWWAWLNGACLLMAEADNWVSHSNWVRIFQVVISTICEYYRIKGKEKRWINVCIEVWGYEFVTNNRNAKCSWSNQYRNTPHREKAVQPCSGMTLGLITFQQDNIERRKTSSPWDSLERENEPFLTSLTKGFLPLTQFLGLGKICSWMRH